MYSSRGLIHVFDCHRKDDAVDDDDNDDDAADADADADEDNDANIFFSLGNGIVLSRSKLAGSFRCTVPSWIPRRWA